MKLTHDVFQFVLINIKRHVRTNMEPAGSAKVLVQFCELVDTQEQLYSSVVSRRRH